VPYVVPGANITKSVTTAFRLVQPGETVTYTLQFTNSDTETITGVVITDTLSADLVNASFTSSGATATARAGSRYVWDVQDLAPGETGFITITAQVSGGAAEGTLINNTAEITASLGGDQSSAAFTVSWWQPVGSEDFVTVRTDGWLLAHHVLVAPDDAGIPYMLYRLPDTSKKAVMQRYINGAWEMVGPATGFSSGSVEFFDLALDSGNVPYVAYQLQGTSYKATVMRYNAGANAWENVGNAGFSAAYTQYISLALDSNDVPYVAYLDYGNSYKATVMRYNAGTNTWETVGNAGFSAGMANFTSLALDSNDVPYVAYKDGGTSNKATVMRYNTGTNTWEPVGSAGFSAGQADFTSLALDSNDVPYVAYKDGGTSNEATVMRYNTGTNTWETVGSAGFSAGQADFTSLALDSNDVPYVAYQDGGNSSKTTVMWYNADASAWQIVGIPGFSAGSAELSQSLTFDKTNRLYVSYMIWREKPA
jgi:uncharacterized repeat protein (TIGR01451 family)